MEHPLRELRRAVGTAGKPMSQKRFGAEVGLHPTYVSQLETGHEPVGKVAALRVAGRFRTEMMQIGITVEDLMRGTRSRGATLEEGAA